MGPRLPLHADAGYLGDPVLSQGPPPAPRRSHLIEKTPTGEPLRQALPRDRQLAALSEEIAALQHRLIVVELELERRTLRGRWRRLHAWASQQWQIWKERFFRG